MENHDIKEVEQSVKRYWYSDGIVEISSGGMFILLGSYFGVLGSFGEKSLISIILQVSLALLMIAGFFKVRWLVNTLKQRLTYPRTGYVEYRLKDIDSRRRRFVIVISAMIISAASIVLIDYIRGLDSMVLITGMLVGVVFIALRGRSSGLKRFYVLGGLAILLGALLSFSSLVQMFNLALFYGLLGLAILVSGVLVFRRYMTDNPLPSGLEHE